MTREETKRDVHHLYGHWRDKIPGGDSSAKPGMFYAWLKSVDRGILGFGNVGPGAIHQHIAVWIEGGRPTARSTAQSTKRRGIAPDNRHGYSW
jgi:hypothetical protein